VCVVVRRGHIPGDLKRVTLTIARMALEFSRVVQTPKMRRPLNVTTSACLGLTGEGETQRQEGGRRMAHKKRGGPEGALDKAMGGVGEAVGRVSGTGGKDLRVAFSTPLELRSSFSFRASRGIEYR
jgi:hypothetical protein